MGYLKYYCCIRCVQNVRWQHFSLMKDGLLLQAYGMHLFLTEQNETGYIRDQCYHPQCDKASLYGTQLNQNRIKPILAADMNQAEPSQMGLICVL